MGKKSIFVGKTLLVIALFVLSLVPIALAENVSFYVRPLVSGEVQPSQAFDYSFNFTSDANCSNVLLSASNSVTTDAYGLGYVSIDVSGLAETPSYICEYRGASLRKAHEINAGLFADIESSQNVNVKKDLVVNGSANFTGSASEVWVNGSRVCTQANGFCSGGNVSGSGSVGYLSRWLSSGSLADSVIFQSLSLITILGNLSVNGSSASIGGSSVCTVANGLCNQSFTDTVWNINGSKYLVNNSGVLDVNETMLNVTVDARDGDTHIIGDGVYLFDNFSVMFFNESRLNATIDARANGNVSGSGSVGYLSRWSSSGSLADSVIFQSLSLITILGNLSVNGSSAKVNGKEVCLSDGTNCPNSTASGWVDSGSIIQLQNTSDDVNATTLFIDNTLGRVGIGTYNLSKTLNVQDSFRVLSSNNTYMATISVDEATASIEFNGLCNTFPILCANQPILKFTFNGSELMRLVSNSTEHGVGIGIKDPQRILHINDTLRVEPRASAPANASLGDIYVDTSNTLCFYNSTGWEAIGGSGACV